METTKKGLLAQLLLILVVVTGCAPWSRGISSIEDFGTDYRDLVLGLTAYTRIHGNSTSRPFKCGFIEGYHDVLAGGNGCPPPIPPKKYWLRYSRLANGQQQISEWFAGFEDGASAAKSNGFDRFGQVPVSPAYQGVRMPYETVYDQQHRQGIMGEETYGPVAVPAEVPNPNLHYGPDISIPLGSKKSFRENLSGTKATPKVTTSSVSSEFTSREIIEQQVPPTRKPTVVLVPKERNSATQLDTTSKHKPTVKSIQDWFTSPNPEPDTTYSNASFAK